MAWEANRVLEGVFLFGAPLNIWRMELDRDRYGGGKYFHIHMQIDDDQNLSDRLMHRIRAETGIEHFPRLIIMEKYGDFWREYVFYKPFIDSLQTNYRPTQYPLDQWKGWTLGIAFEKSAANKSSVLALFRTLSGAVAYP